MALGRRAFLGSLGLTLAACARPQAVVSERPARLEPTPSARVSGRAVPAPVSGAAAAAGRTQAPPVPLVEDGALQRRLDTFLREQRGQFGVVVRDLHGPVRAAHHPRERFPLGSLFKLFVMFEVMRQARAGAFALTDGVRTAAEYTFGEPQGGVPPNTRLSVDEALAAMISVSSNAAALALIELVSPPAVMAAPRRLGMQDTAIDVAPAGGPGRYEIDARGSAEDIAELLVKLDREQLVGPDQDRRMVDLLLGQKIADRLPALLPSDVPVAHKTADLEGFTHDAGMIYLPGRPYVATVLAQGESPVEGKAIVAEISRLVFGYFRGS